MSTGCRDGGMYQMHRWLNVIRKQNTHARMVLYLLLVLLSEAIGACSFCTEQHRLKVFPS